MSRATDSASTVRRVAAFTTTLATLAIASPAVSPSLTAQATTGTRPETAADARLLEAIDLYTGVAGRVDDARAQALLLDVARDPADVLAQMWIARVHSRGRMGFTRNEASARKIAGAMFGQLRSLAAAGDIEAQFLMGTAYDEGLGPTVDYPEAMRWYKRAAARGHVLAVHNVGNMYRDGRGVEVDHATAAQWWLRAARAGDAIPQLRLGEAFEAGRGVTGDLDAARYWYGRSAAAGNAAAAEALRRLG